MNLYQIIAAGAAAAGRGNRAAWQAASGRRQLRHDRARRVAHADRYGNATERRALRAHGQEHAPTPSGEVLARHARKLTHDLDQMAQDFTAHLSGRSGSVRVGAVTGAAALVIPAILRLKHEP